MRLAAARTKQARIAAQLESQQETAAVQNQAIRPLGLKLARCAQLVQEEYEPDDLDAALAAIRRGHSSGVRGRTRKAYRTAWQELQAAETAYTATLAEIEALRAAALQSNEAVAALESRIDRIGNEDDNQDVRAAAGGSVTIAATACGPDRRQLGGSVPAAAANDDLRGWLEGLGLGAFHEAIVNDGVAYVEVFRR